MGILDWLNTNSGAVQGIAACVTVFVTGFLACVTWKYTRLIHRLVQLGTEPAVDVTLGPGMNDNTLIIANNGVDKVLEVRVDLDDYHFAIAKNRPTKITKGSAPAMYTSWPVLIRCGLKLQARTACRDRRYATVRRPQANWRA